MGWLDSLITGAFGTAQQVAQNDFNADEAEKNREFQSAEAELARTFQANEAALQREWSSQEAEQARAWQEEMNAKYNSISGKIAQAESAGVNPMFAVTGNAVSPASASASAPSGASAGSVGAPSGSAASNGMLNILGAILDAKKVDAEIDLIKSEADKNRADSNSTIQMLSHQIRNIDSISALNEAKVVESATNVEKLKSDMNLNTEQAKVFAAQVTKLNEEADRISKIKEHEVREAEARSFIAKWENENKETFKAIDIGAEGLRILTDLGLGIFSTKTQLKIAHLN